MRSSSLLTAAALASLATAYLVAPPTTAAANTIADCSFWAVVASTDTCTSLSDGYGITLAQFDKYNPSAGATTTCKLVVGNSYCVEENYGVGATTSSSAVSTVHSTSTRPSTTKTPPPTTGNGITTPLPIQTGMVGSCNRFYLVQAGDQCGTIAAAHGISLANLYAWNPAVGSTCATLWASNYVCVNVIGGATSSIVTITKTPGNGVSTPSPIQTGMVGNCNKFYFVKTGDQCGTIASAQGISLANFYAWNPAVGSTCASLWVGNYVCVYLLGGTPPPTTTAHGNGVATPTPVQAGMSTKCNKFHLVVGGDQCGNIATAAGISLANFYAWNPAVGSTCASLWAGYYCCIGTQ